MTYQPKPIDTSAVTLDAEILRLTEQLSRHAHDVWAEERVRLGWTYGPARDDVRLQHPSLVPYEHLSESEKQFDRNAVLGTLRAILALGYRIEK